MIERSPTRVLYVEGNRDGTIGGSYFSLYYLVTGLDRRWFEPLVVFSTANALVDDFRASNIDTRVVRMPGGFSAKWKLPRFFAWPINAILENVLMPIRIMRMLKQERIELIHLNNSTTGNHEWMIAALLSHIPCMTHERGINGRFSLRTRILARRLSAIVCISDAVRRNFAVRNLKGLRLVTVLNGLDPEQMRVSRSRDTVRRSLGIDAGQPVIGLIGNLKPWKGQETVVNAVGILRRRWPKLRCLLIGDVAPGAPGYREQLRCLVSDLGVEDNIVVTGYRKDIADYVNALDVVIHASTSPEPFGRVLLEAMALRKPVVASRGGAVPEIIEEGVTGLTFAPGDPHDLARCVAQLLQDPFAGAAMGDSGYKRLVAKFGMRRNVELTQQLYAQVLGKTCPMDPERG